MAIKLHPPAGESRAEPSCELLKRYDISSAPLELLRREQAGPRLLRLTRLGLFVALDCQAGARSSLAPGRDAARTLPAHRHPHPASRLRAQRAAESPSGLSIAFARDPSRAHASGLTNKAFPRRLDRRGDFADRLLVLDPRIRSRRPHRHGGASCHLCPGRFRVGRFFPGEIRQGGKSFTPARVEFLSTHHHRRAALPFLLPCRL